MTSRARRPRARGGARGENATTDSGASTRRSRFGLALIAVALTVAVVRLGRLLATWATDVYVWDQWDFLDPLFRPRSCIELFRWQHGPHRMGLGLPMMVAVETWTRWNAVAIGWLNLAVLLLAALLALGLKRRLGGRLDFIDAAVPLLFLASSQWHALFGVPNTSHGPLPLLLVTAFALLLTLPASWTRTLLLLVVDLCAIYTGMGLWLGALAPVVLLCEARRRDERVRALVGLAACLLLAASFLLGYESRPGPCLDGRLSFPVWERPAFFALLFARAFGVTQVSGAGVLLGALLAAPVCWLALSGLAALVRRDQERATSALFVLAAFSVAFAAATTIGRGCFGASGALEARYVPYLVPGLFAAFVRWAPAAALRPARPLRLAGVCAVVAVYVALDFRPRPLEQREWAATRDGRRQWIACVVAGGPPARCQRELGVTVHPDPKATRLGEKVAMMRRERLGFFASPVAEPDGSAGAGASDERPQPDQR
jgi:hypothetical protein